MTTEQEKQVRELYARVLMAGDGNETMPQYAADVLAERESIDAILDQLGDHPDLDDILGDDDE